MSKIAWHERELKYMHFLILSRQPKLIHGIFTRLGGASKPPFESLNVSYSVGDQRENVTRNLKKITETLEADRLIFMNQAHGTDILILHQSESLDFHDTPRADAMITNRPDVALMVKQADCQAVILYDPQKHVLSNIHCGWRGNVKHILGRVVHKMHMEFGCAAGEILAAIGPSLGPCCAEFISHKQIFPKEFRQFMVRENHFDLWAISKWQLIEAGLQEKNIQIAEICTRCRTDLFYSYRGEGKTGRFGTVAMLKR